MLKNLFANETQEVQTKSNQLDNTAQLTRISSEIAREIIKMAEADLEKFNDLIFASQQSHDAMDELINQTYDLSVVDVDFLKTVESDVIDRMIKSQQSKRSRAKSKAMTFENYLNMLTGAVAENLLRIAGNKPKTAGSGFKRTTITYTEEELQRLANDPEALKKAIRNIQSKKSIEKTKADFSEESERWKALLEAEEQLKALRDGQNAEIEKALETTNKLEEMLASVDTKDLKAGEAKEMLERIQQMLMGNGE